ncbi:hypothetical protein LJR029_005331 [Caballeronia sp. LjRoot29]|uniref:hypothetical protein n=1 Tax=Caballeronia sp. LjRoot29 TaxID=3342315 RepID=UPI003ECE4A47
MKKISAFTCLAAFAVCRVASATTVEDNIRASAVPAPYEASTVCPASARTHNDQRQNSGVPVGEAAIALYEAAKIGVGSLPPELKRCPS